MGFPLVNICPTGMVSFDATETYDIKFLSNVFDFGVTSYQIYIYRKVDSIKAYDSGKISSLNQDSDYVYHHTLPANSLTNGVDYYIEMQAWNEDIPPKVGPLSSSVYFSCISKPSVTVTPAGTYAYPDLLVHWAITNGGGKQTNYQVIVKEAGSIVADSGLIKGSETEYAFDVNVFKLISGHTYQITIMVTTASGVEGNGTTNINVSYSDFLPPKPDITLAIDATASNVTITISNPNPGAGQEIVRYNKLMRKKENGEWFAVAKVATNGSYTDNAVRFSSLVYKVIAVANNLKETSSDTKSIEIKASYAAQLYAVSNITTGINMKYNFECTESFEREKSFSQYNGREKPVVDVGDGTSRQLSISFATKWFEDVTRLKNLEMLDFMLFYRDKAGREMYCSINSGSIKVSSKKRHLYSISLELIEVDYSAEV